MDYYEALYKKLSDGEIKVGNDTVAADASSVPVELVTVEEIK